MLSVELLSLCRSSQVSGLRDAVRFILCDRAACWKPWVPAGGLLRSFGLELRFFCLILLVWDSIGCSWVVESCFLE